MSKLMTIVVLLALAAPIALPAVFIWHRAFVDLSKRLLARGRVHNAALAESAKKLVAHADKTAARSASHMPTRPQ
jgi:hypothetical protein